MPLIEDKKSKRIFDYHEREFKNPFFSRKKHPINFKSWKTRLILGIIVLFFGAASWFFYFSNFWRITKISVNGTNRVPGSEVYKKVNEQISKRIFFFFPSNNIIFFNNQKVSLFLKGEYRFSEVVVEKKWPNELNISIKEKPFACVWNESDKYYYADNEGYILEEINSFEIKDKKYPLITNRSREKISDYRIKEISHYISEAEELLKKISEKSLNITVDRFIIDNDLDTIKIETAEGPEISFSTKSDFSGQLEKLYVAKTQKLKDDFYKKKHVDLRFGDKVYYQ